MRSKNDIVIEFRANIDELAEMARACHEAGVPETRIATIARTFMLFGLQVLPTALKYHRQKYTKEEALYYLRSIGVESSQFSERLTKQVAMGLALESLQLTAKEMETIIGKAHDIELVNAADDPDLAKFIDDEK